MQVRGRNLAEGLKNLRKKLYIEGYNITSNRWQGKESPPEFLEILHADMVAPMYSDPIIASGQLGATQPWADLHFKERVGGLPVNPPPSHTMWLKDTDQYLSDVAFSHSYPERMWQPSTPGIRFDTADLDKAVELLRKEPDTRQCYIPIWFPEDLSAACLGERVPCTFGWHFMLRNYELHCFYPMRSCDVVRHLHNDLYFANCLADWLITEAGLDAYPGQMHFSSSSLHCFENDRYALKKLIGE